MTGFHQKEVDVFACALCESPEISRLPHLARAGLTYGHCHQCDLIFVDPKFLLSVEDEKARYETHQNDVGDPGYERFLRQLWDPMHELLKQEKNFSEGLDFGCGPGPALQRMIEQAGYGCDIYDPFYAPEQKIFEKTYDFVTCTEVVEHFHFPSKAWAQLLGRVRMGGVVGVMTQLHPGGASAADFFPRWWYARDPAHVSFYSEKTLCWIFSQAGFEILKLQAPIVIARKNSTDKEARGEF
jgi:hypothetical protein